MLRVLLCLGLSVLACAASAARPSTFQMTCDEARGFVATQGAVVMSTGQHTFERFVADWSFCSVNEYADWAWAPTSDAPQCPIGYACKYRPAPWEDF